MMTRADPWKYTFTVRILIVLAVVFSLASLGGPGSSQVSIPAIHPVFGCVGGCSCQTHNSEGSCSDSWYPAGPAMDTLVANIFTDETAEFNNILSSSPSIDLTDWPLPPSLIQTFTTSPNFLITAATGQVGYYEV